MFNILHRKMAQKSTGYSSRRPRCDSQQPQGDSPSGTSVLWNLTSSSGLHRHQAHKLYTNIQAGKTLILIKYKINVIIITTQELDASAIKTTCCPLRGPWFSSQIKHNGLQPTIIPGDPTSSSDLHGQQTPHTNAVYTCRQAGKTLIHLKLKKKKLFKTFKLS